MSRDRLSVAALVIGLTVAMGTIAGSARAEEVVVERGTRPNLPLITSGIVTFAIPYAISVGVGATSGSEADRMLFIPLVGPWVDLATRTGCPTVGGTCSGETAAKAGLVVDGIFQGIGVVAIVSGLLWRQERYTRIQRSGIDWIAPWTTASGVGLSVAGHF